MNQAEHEAYLKEIKTGYGKGGLVPPHKEGAFCFGCVTYDEYVDLYESMVEDLKAGGPILC